MTRITRYLIGQAEQNRGDRAQLRRIAESLPTSHDVALATAVELLGAVLTLADRVAQLEGRPAADILAELLSA